MHSQNGYIYGCIYISSHVFHHFYQWLIWCGRFWRSVQNYNTSSSIEVETLSIPAQIQHRLACETRPWCATPFFINKDDTLDRWYRPFAVGVAYFHCGHSTCGSMVNLCASIGCSNLGDRNKENSFYCF